MQFSTFLWTAFAAVSAASNVPSNTPLDQLDNNLLKSFSPNPQERTLAEYNLSELAKKEEFLPSLLYKCTMASNENVRIAAAICIKNTLLTRYKKKSSDALLSANEQQYFLQYLIPSMINSSMAVMKNLMESLNLLAVRKGHELWPPFLSQVSQELQSRNEFAFFKGLLVLKFFTKFAKAKSINVVLNTINTHLLPLITQYLSLLASSIHQGNPNSTKMAAIIVKIIVLNPSSISSVFPQVAHLLLMPIPNEPSEDFWKLKIECYRLLEALFKSHRERCSEFLLSLYQTFQTSLASLTLSTSHLPNRLLSIVLNNLNSILDCPVISADLQANMPVIFPQIIFTKGIAMRENDLDLFDEDPEEYLRMRHYFINQMNDLPLSCAIKLVEKIAETNFLMQITDYCLQMLSTMNKLEDIMPVDCIDGASIVLGSISHKRGDQINSSTILKVYFTLIDQGINLLTARAIWLVGRSRKLFKDREEVLQIIKSMKLFLTHENYAIRNSATHSFKLFLKMPLSRGIFKENGVEMFEILFDALQKYGDYRLTTVFDSFVKDNVQALLPYSSAIVPKLISVIETNLSVISSRKGDQSTTVEFRSATCLLFTLDILIANGPVGHLDSIFGVIEKFMTVFPGDFSPVISILKAIIPALSIPQLNRLMEAARYVFVAGMLEECHTLLYTVLSYRKDFFASAQTDDLFLIHRFIGSCLKSGNFELTYFGHSLYKITIENAGSSILSKVPFFLDVVLPVEASNILLHVINMSTFPIVAKNFLLQHEQWDNFLQLLVHEASNGSPQILHSVEIFASFLPPHILKAIISPVLSHIAAILAFQSRPGPRLVNPNNEQNSNARDLETIGKNIELLINASLEVKLGLSAEDKKNLSSLKRYLTLQLRG